LYTDGITEAENLAKEQYGLDRLCRVAQRHRASSAHQIKDAVVGDITRYIGRHPVLDDITLVVLKVA
jgi:serine phosphatase RsbU (regulator of sigma subunit)